MNREGVLGSERCAGGAPLLSFCVTRATFSPRQHLAVVGARYEEPAEATADSAALLEILPGGGTSNASGGGAAAAPPSIISELAMIRSIFHITKVALVSSTHVDFHTEDGQVCSWRPPLAPPLANPAFLTLPRIGSHTQSPSFPTPCVHSPLFHTPLLTLVHSRPLLHSHFPTSPHHPRPSPAECHAEHHAERHDERHAERHAERYACIHAGDQHPERRGDAASPPYWGQPLALRRQRLMCFLLGRC